MVATCQVKKKKYKKTKNLKSIVAIIKIVVNISIAKLIIYV